MSIPVIKKLLSGALSTTLVLASLAATPAWAQPRLPQDSSSVALFDLQAIIPSVTSSVDPIIPDATLKMIKELVREIERLSSKDDTASIVKSSMMKLQILSQLGVLTEKARVFYPLMGLDLFPSAWTNVIGLTLDLNDGDIEAERKAFWEEIRQESGNVTQQPYKGNLQNVRQDFYKPSAYAATVKAAGVNVVYVKTLTLYLLYREQQKAFNSETESHIDLKQIRRQVLDVFKVLNDILPTGTFVVFSELSDFDVGSEDHLYESLIRELGYQDYLAEHLPADLAQKLHKLVPIASHQIKMQSESEYRHHIAPIGGLYVLQKPDKQLPAPKKPRSDVDSHHRRIQTSA